MIDGECERLVLPFCVFLTLDKFLSLAPSSSPKGCLAICECEESVAIVAVDMLVPRGV